jgi:hypothetical protein
VDAKAEKRIVENDRELRYKLSTTPQKTELSPSEHDLFVSSIGRDLSIPPEQVSWLHNGMLAAKSLSDIRHLKLVGYEVKLPEWATWIDSTSLPINK